MAFKDVSKKGFSGETRKAKDLKIGESLTAYVVRPDQYEHDGKKFNNLVMQDENGVEFLLQACGNLSYMVQDGKVKSGLLTQITKIGEISKVNKRTMFEVLQDDEKTIEVANTQAMDTKFAALGGADNESAPAERNATIAKAAEQGIKNQAQKLANSMKRA